MKKIIKIFSLIIILILILTDFVFATDATDIGGFIGNTTTVTETVGLTLNSILFIIQVIGMAVAIIMLLVLGIKYMVSSVSDRAEIKKHAVVYVVGAILLFGASGIVEIIKQFSENIK